MVKPNVAMTVLLCLSFIMVTDTTYAQQLRDKITPEEPMNSTGYLVSPSGSFRLGFFIPGSSKNRYLGIWYNNIAVHTVVWVANRDIPIPPESSRTASHSGGAVLRLDSNGTFFLTNDDGTVLYWYSNSSSSPGGGTTASSSSPPVAWLLDTGNLQVVEAADRNKILWQSFDYPTDTLLPGMKMGMDLRTGLVRRTTAWKSSENPAPGDVSMGMDVRGVPQIFLRLQTDAGNMLLWRTGPWIGKSFSGAPEANMYATFSFFFVADPDEVYYQYTGNASFFSHLTVNSSGIAQYLWWVERTGSWNTFWGAPIDLCDAVNRCGPYQVCVPNAAPPCNCLPGYRPKTDEGCERVKPKDCSNGTDRFVVVRGAKLPDTSNATLVRNGSMGLDQCAAECLRNCSCTAYAAANIGVPAQNGCIIWTSELRDLRVYDNAGQDLYIRLAAEDPGSSSSQRQRLIGILVPVLAGAGVLGCVVWVRHQRNKRSKRKIPRTTIRKREHRDYKYNINIAESEEALQDLDLPLFEFSDVMVATDHFSDQNKLGKGGFGPVYKGRLEDGHDVAIKRLARNSLQGTDEFKNEVILIAKLQHRNLVRILGCCIQGEERMLIYEYMPNGSLDSVLFDKEKSSSLDWNARYRIIEGIARGLLYLHQDSRLRVIHRDLKASNVLLDKDLMPKISDFGMARIFGGDETEANTRRVVGTFGYMSPEYVMEGIFSIKSDVFSFGVLVLEIVSGMRNRGVFHAQTQQNLLGHVWSLWEEGAVLELVDKSPGYPSSTSEVMKCVGIGLLCVQEHPKDRPTMSSVVSMLGSDSALLPQPKQPGFTIGRTTFEKDSSSGKHEPGSVNQMSLSIFQGR